MYVLRRGLCRRRAHAEGGPSPMRLGGNRGRSAPVGPPRSARQARRRPRGRRGISDARGGRRHRFHPSPDSHRRHRRAECARVATAPTSALLMTTVSLSAPPRHCLMSTSATGPVASHERVAASEGATTTGTGSLLPVRASLLRAPDPLAASTSAAQPTGTGTPPEGSRSAWPGPGAGRQRLPPPPPAWTARSARQPAKPHRWRCAVPTNTIAGSLTPCRASKLLALPLGPRGRVADRAPQRRR